jgi:integrase
MANSGHRRAKITKRTVDASEPGNARYIIWDTLLPGFGLRVETSGRKSFIARYRAGGGRTGTLRQATIGRYGTLTTDKARELAKKMLGAAASGKDPVGERRSARQPSITVAELCDWYLREARAGRLLGRQGRPIKGSTLAMDESRNNAHVKPLIGNRRVRDLTTAELAKMQADIAAGKTKREADHESGHAKRDNGEEAKSRRGGTVRGGATVAGRTLGMLYTIFEHGMYARLISTNPAKGARRIKPKQRQARLSLGQLTALGKAMRAEGENPTGVAAIRAIALTGFRRDEALAIKRNWLLDTGGVLFPDTKSDGQVRPIGKAALDVLNAQRDISGDDADWLFPADRGDGHFIGVRKVLSRVANKAGLSGVTPHVLRHTFASVAGDLGFSELTIKGLLGHTSRGVTQGYVHLDRALVTAADRVSEVIAAALDGQSGEVVALDDTRSLREAQINPRG